MPTVPFGDRIAGLRAGDGVIRALPEGFEDVVLDLTAVRFADPSGVVALATSCIEAIGMGNTLSLKTPDDRNVTNYLLRMRFRDLLLAEGVEFSGAFAESDVNAQPLAERLLELQCVDATTAEEVSQSLVTIATAAGIPEAVVQPAFLGLAEAVDNAIEHSRAGRAIVMAQRYRNKDGRMRVEIAVGDTGVGLRETLRRRYEVPDDLTAVEIAIERGVSRRAGPGRRGYGLSSVIEAVCRGAGGSFEIRSGDASLASRGRVIFDPRTHGVSRDGVQIAVSVTAPAGS